MTHQEDKSQKTKRLNGTIWTIVVLGVMVIALVAFVMTSDRSSSVTAIALTRTAAYMEAQATSDCTLINQAYPIVLPAEVDINGILLMGGLLVLVVFFTVIREAILHKRA